MKSTTVNQATSNLISHYYNEQYCRLNVKFTEVNHYFIVYMKTLESINNHLGFDNKV